MSFCKSCGTQIENENAQFCPKCGTAITQPQQQWTPDYATGTPTEQFKMKWYKWLIYFVLFAGALLNFVNGFNYITGGIYFTQSDGKVTAEEVYSLLGEGLKTVDVAFGIALIAIAAFGIYTRFRLAKFKANGPMCLYILYGAGLVASLVYNIAAASFVEGSFTSDIVTSIVGPAIVIWVNYVYFNKRKSLFIN